MAINAFVESPELDVVLPDPLIDADTVPYAFLKGDPGFSPVVQVADVQGGHNVTITDAEGDHTFFVPDGQDGDDGVSPTVSVVETAGGHIVTITDESGAHVFTVLNGKNGDPGNPGFSPEVSVTQITGGHQVTITDATGSQSFDVMDGAPGQDATAFVVNYAIGQNSVTCDKTFAEIAAAAQSGTPISVTASGMGIAGQTSNVYIAGTTIYSVLRYDLGGVHQFIIIEHYTQDSILMALRQDPTVDQQLDSESNNAISNAAVAAALNDLPVGPGLSDTPPLMDGAADPGTSVDAARADHVHPSDTSKLDVDGDARRASALPIGHLDSTSTSTVMTATIPGITDLHGGVHVWLRNGVVKSASGFTLNINGLGAKPVYSSLAAASRSSTIFDVGYTLMFIYDEDRVEGGCWDIVYGIDSNTNTIGYQLRTNSTRLPMDSITYRYRLLFTSADGQKFVPANNSSSINATEARTVCQGKIDPHGGIFYYGTTASVAAGAMPAAACLWTQYVVTLGYSFNRTNAALELTSFAPVYVKCTPQTDGSAIIDPDTPYTQELPTTADGKIYIFLGVAVSATTIELVPEHPVYEYRNGAIRRWVGPAESIPTKTSDLVNDSGFVDASGAEAAAPVRSVNGQTGAVQIAALPAVTSEDNGKFLCVDNGAWAAVTVPSAAGVSF